MNKRTVMLFVLVSLIIGGVIGGYTVKSLSSDENAVTDKQSDNADSSNNAKEPQVTTKYEMSGYGLSPVEMYDALDAMEPGDAFDWRYINYLQELRLNEIGMSRIAAEKATQPRLKAIAQEQIQLSTDLNTELAKWRGVWGFTDH